MAVDRNQRDDRGLSPAMLALYRGEREEAEALLPDQPTVFEAAAFGRVDLLAELLEGDPDLAREFSGDGFTALHLAAFMGQPDAVRILLAHSSDPNAVATNEQIGPVQPLHSAAAAGQVECARLLIEGGANVNARQERGFTPLHSAALGRHEVLARLLLTAGADPEARADDGQIPALDFLA